MRPNSIRCPECVALNEAGDPRFRRPRQYMPTETEAKARTYSLLVWLLFATFTLGFGFGAMAFAILDMVTK